MRAVIDLFMDALVVSAINVAIIQFIYIIILNRVLKKWALARVHQVLMITYVLRNILNLNAVELLLTCMCCYLIINTYYEVTDFFIK